MRNHLRAIAALGVVAIASVALTGLDARTDVALSGTLVTADIGGTFHLASANGGYIDSQDLIGKPYGVFFGYTHCPDVCPSALYAMSLDLDELGDSAKEFRLFFITVDPERDTAGVLRDYISNFDPRIVALVPTPNELAAVAKTFRAIYQKVPIGDGDYSMNHTAIVYLMGRDGHLASTIDFGEDETNRLAKLRHLMNRG
jgi:protein SCO1/2